MFERAAKKPRLESKAVNLRLRPEEHALLVLAAENAGLTVSDLVRDALGAYLAQDGPGTSTGLPSGPTA